MEPGPGGLLFLTSDDRQVVVDKHELRWTSKVFQDLLADCDTGQASAVGAGPQPAFAGAPPGAASRVRLAAHAAAAASPPGHAGQG
jgi:hypothetical protein